MAEQTKTSSTKITLRTVEGTVFEVDALIAMDFQTVRACIEAGDGNVSSVIPLHNVGKDTLSKIIDYYEHHVEFRAKSKRVTVDSSSSSTAADEVKAFNDDYIKGLSNEEMKDLLLAANYLGAKEFLDFLNQAVAHRIQNKSVEYVRNFFGINNDYTPEEEEAIRRKNAWAFVGVDDD